MAKKKNEAAAEITVEKNEKTENAAETAKNDTAAETAVAVPSEEKADEKKAAERKPRKAASSETVPAEKPAKTTKGRKAKSKEETSAVEETPVAEPAPAPAAEETPKKARRGKAKAADAAEKTSSGKRTVSSRKSAADKKKIVKEEAAEKPKRAVRASKAKETVSPYDATVKLVSNKVCKIRTAKKDLAAQFTLTGSAEGVFFVKCEGGKVAVEPWDYKDADINVTVDNDTLKKLIEGKAELYKAVEKGLIEMSCGVNSQGEANSKLNLSTIVALKKILFN